MYKLSQSASMWRLLATAYLVVSVPAFVFVKLMSNALDYRIEQAQYSLSDGDKFAFDTTPRSTWLIGIGAYLRKAKLPFSVAPSFNDASTRNRMVAQNLSDVRTALIYVWATIFLAGGLAILRLGFILNRPLLKLTNSIERLARDDLEEPVNIVGPGNIEEMGKGLEKLRRRLLESSKQQMQFLRHISHEIKTPLTTIKEGSKLLDDQLLGSLNPEQIEVAEILVKSSTELQIAIENLLNYSAAVSQQGLVQRDLADIPSLIHRAIEKHELSIRQKELIVVNDISPCKIYADETQILTVFDNLISNAVKHSPQSGQLSLQLNPLKNNSIEFIIRDQGPGVKKEQRHAIFDAFFVGDQAAQTTLKGTGLGLSIAKQYIEAHDGIIQLLNTRKGAEFRVVLGNDT